MKKLPIDYQIELLQRAKKSLLTQSRNAKGYHAASDQCLCVAIRRSITDEEYDKYNLFGHDSTDIRLLFTLFTIENAEKFAKKYKFKKPIPKADQTYGYWWKVGIAGDHAFAEKGDPDYTNRIRFANAMIKETKLLINN